MLLTTREEYEGYLYTKLQLRKAGIYRALYNKAEEWFRVRDFNEKNCIELLQTIETDISPSTYNNYLKALKKLANLQGFTFLDSYKQKKTEQPYIDILEEHEMVGILHDAYNTDYRRALALECFLRTGLRANELISLEWSDYHIQRIFIQKTKTSRSRIVEILPDLSDKIEKLRGYHPRYVFGTHKGQLSRSKFNIFLQSLLKKRSINKYITTHKLRHSYATLCANKGISHFVIQDMMGHTSLNTTQSYIHTTTSMKRDAAKKVSLGKYKLSYVEAVEELSRYVGTLDSSESEIKITKEEDTYTIQIKKKK